MSESLPYAYGCPAWSGAMRVCAADFQVDEELGFEPDGEGEHVYLQLQKCQLNTMELAKRIADCAGVALRSVSFSGMKDRQALTSQWFSVHLPGRQDPDWQPLQDEKVTLLRARRHGRKLRRGMHRANHFRIRLRNWQGDPAALAQRVAQVARQGVPNYFGEQRFGRDGRNLDQALQWFRGQSRPGRALQGILLSAARSYLFNRVLADRVAAGDWNAAVAGELLMLDGSRSLFAFAGEADTPARLQAGDIHPSGPLYGRPGKLACGQPLAEREAALLDAFPDLLAGLERAGLNAERRSLRLLPANLQHDFDQQGLLFSFSLGRGCFATAVMRELSQYHVDNAISA